MFIAEPIQSRCQAHERSAASYDEGSPISTRTTETEPITRSARGTTDERATPRLTAGAEACRAGPRIE